jgi:hypothetical protein
LFSLIYTTLAFLPGEIQYLAKAEVLGVALH